MPEIVRVYLNEGDEQQLADIEMGEYVEFVGLLNGEPVTVRFLRPWDSEK